MVTYVEAPAEPESTEPSSVLFLAGGITGCPNWQHDAVRLLEEIGRPLTVLNPRRAHFPIEDPAAHEEQVAWECRHLKKADHVLFWFPGTQVQPIALYELGMAAGTGRDITVGCDPAYSRARDVVAQLSQARPDVAVVHSTLEETVDAAAANTRRRTATPPVVDVDQAGLDDRGAYEVTIWVDRAPAALRSVLPTGATLMTPHHGEVRILEQPAVHADRIIYRANPVWDLL